MIDNQTWVSSKRYMEESNTEILGVHSLEIKDLQFDNVVVTSATVSCHYGATIDDKVVKPTIFFSVLSDAPSTKSVASRVPGAHQYLSII